MKKLHVCTALWLLAACARAEHVWIEGEKPARADVTRHSWYDRVNKKVMSGGEWLSHYNGGKPGTATYEFTIKEGGPFRFWLRCNSLKVQQSYRIDGGKWVKCSFSDARGRMHVSPRPDHRTLAWHKMEMLKLRAGKHTLTIRFHSKVSNHGGVDCLLLTSTSFAPSGTRKPTDQAAAGPDVWFEVFPDDDPFSPASITDMSRLVERPAGKFGPLKAVGDRLMLGKREMKFWGCGANIDPRAPREVQERRVRYLAKHGINMVRQLSPGTEGGF